MGDVIDFPLKRDIVWSDLEKHLRQAFQKLQAPEDLINDICVRVKQTYDKITPSPTFKITITLSSPELAEEQITREVQKIREIYKDLVWSVFSDMIITQINLYKRLTKG